MAVRKSKATPEAKEEVPAKPAVKVKPAKAEVKEPKKTPVSKKKAAEPKPEVAEAPAKAETKAKAAKPAKAKIAVPAPEPQAPAIPAAAPLPVALPALAASILSAIQEGRAVEFIFSDGDANPPRTFEPRQLIFDVFTKAWFVWGWDRRYNAERHHRVDLLAEVNAVEGVGRSAQGPYKEGTPSNQIGGWLGGEAIAVKATLFKQWVFAVKQAPAPFPDFKLEDAEEGKAMVSFTGTDLRAIARWCMQFGDGIQVLEPARLVDRIKQVGTTWAGKPKVVEVAVPAPKPLPTRSEPRPERQDREPSRRHQDAPPPRETRESREPETPKGKGGRIEIRFDRL